MIDIAIIFCLLHH